MNGKKLEDLKDDFRFWTGLYDDDYFKWASDKAYLDMNRTMTFKEVGNTEKEKKDIQSKRAKLRDDVTNEVIKQKFLKYSGQDFYEWHEDVCNAIIKKYNNKLVKREGNSRTEEYTDLTYGQAQKWLNMTIKYLWLIKRLGLVKDEKEEGKKIIEIFSNYEKKFDVPLDSYIIRYLEQKPNKKKEPPQFELSKIKSDKISAEWSKISNHKDYKEYQINIKKAISENGNYKSCLEWELKNWHEAIEYYNNK